MTRIKKMLCILAALLSLAGLIVLLNPRWILFPRLKLSEPRAIWATKFMYVSDRGSGCELHQIVLAGNGKGSSVWEKFPKRQREEPYFIWVPRKPMGISVGVSGKYTGGQRLNGDGVVEYEVLLDGE